MQLGAEMEEREEEKVEGGGEGVGNGRGAGARGLAMLNVAMENMCPSVLVYIDTVGIKPNFVIGHYLSN